MPCIYLCKGYKSKTDKYNNKTYMCGPNKTTLVITIPRIRDVRTVEIKEICKRKWKDIIGLEYVILCKILQFSFLLG